MQPRQTGAPRGFALRLELSLAMSDLRAFQSPLTDGHVRLFIAHIALFLASSTHPSATNKRRGFKCGRSKHAHHGFALRLRPCNVRPAVIPAATNGLSCAFVLLHFLHYFHSFIPSSGTKKAPGPQMQPRQTCASRLALRLEHCNVRPVSFPADTNGLSCASVYCTYCIISYSFNPSFHHKKRQGFK